MELLKKIGLVEILENGEIYCTQVSSMIGEKSVGAFKKQQQRLLAKGKEEMRTRGRHLSTRNRTRTRYRNRTRNRYRTRRRKRGRKFLCYWCWNFSKWRSRKCIYILWKKYY